MKNIRLRTCLPALAIAAVLGGCGSSDSDNDNGPEATRTTDVPASAQSSVDGLIAYMNGLISAMTNDSSESILVGDAVLPTSETTEPAAINP